MRHLASFLLPIGLLAIGILQAGDSVYYPPPDSAGGWRTLKNDAEIRRKAALALLHEAYGLPPTSQEVVRPSTTVNVGQLNMGASLSPEAAYALMCSGVIPASGDHEAFEQRPLIEQTS